MSCPVFFWFPYIQVRHYKIWQRCLHPYPCLHFFFFDGRSACHTIFYMENIFPKLLACHQSTGWCMAWCQNSCSFVTLSRYGGPETFLYTTKRRYNIRWGFGSSWCSFHAKSERCCCTAKIQAECTVLGWNCKSVHSGVASFSSGLSIWRNGGWNATRPTNWTGFSGRGERQTFTWVRTYVGTRFHFSVSSGIGGTKCYTSFNHWFNSCPSSSHLEDKGKFQTG